MAKAKGKSKDAAPFALENIDCVMTGMTLSFDMDGDEPVERRTLSLEGMSRTEQEIDAHLGIYTWRSWFNVDAATKLPEPMPWWAKRESRDFQLTEKFDVKTLTIKCGTNVLKFASEKHESGDGETPAGKIKEIVYEPQVGGISLMSMKLSVRPDPDQAAILTEYFKRHVKITLGALTAGDVEKAKQGELPVSEQGSGKPANGDQATRDAAVDAAGSGSQKPIDGTTSKSRAKAKSDRDAASKH